MSELRTSLEQLLATLRGLGHAGDADALAASFAAKSWRVDVQDQLEVLAALQRATLAQFGMQRSADPPPTVVEARQPAVVEAPKVLIPPKFEPFATFGPWVATLPMAWRLVEAVHDIFAAPTRADLEIALRKMFVDLLGHEPVSLDETRRISHQSTVTHLSAVARHGDFFVLLAVSSYAGPYLTSYEPLFRLHPHALIVGLEAGHRIRLVTRVGAGSHPLRSRILRGHGTRSFPDDDLFIWSRRLGMLEPGPRDDGRELAKRAHELIERTAAEISATWDSCLLEASEIPGRSWEDSPAQEVESFLQPAVARQRWWYGLEAELRVCFPWTSRDGIAVECSGYRVVSMQDDVDDALRRKASTCAIVELDLVHVAADTATRSPVTVIAALLLPDAAGRFVIRGELFSFTPGLCASEQTSERAVFDEEEGEQRPEEEDDELDDEQDSENGDEEIYAETYADPADYSGAGLVPLLRWSVGRRLRWLALKLSRARVGILHSPQALAAWLGRWSNERAILWISSTAVLRRHLSPPAPHGLRVLRVAPLAPPPSWACLELSMGLPPGIAHPVAGARIGPGGVLAAPLPEGSAALRLSARAVPATTSNPRTHRIDWKASYTPFIGRALEPWANTRAGTLADPIATANGYVRRGRFIRIGGPQLVLRLAKHHVYCERRHSQWHIDLPARADMAAGVVELLNKPTAIEPGTLLMAVDSHTWATDPLPEEHELVRVAQAIDEMTSRPRDAALRIHAPPSLTGMLDRAHVADVLGIDHTVIARRASFRTCHQLWPVCAVLPDGRSAPIEWVPVADLPWNPEDGEVATGLIVDPSPTSMTSPPDVWYDGATDEPIETLDLLASLTFLGQRPVGPDPALRSRVVDGWGHPRAAADPALSYAELRWLQAAHPDRAAALHRVVEATHGGIVPPSSTIAELAYASHVSFPFLLQEGVDVEAELPTLPPYDPTRAPRPRRWCISHSPGGSWQWRCRCGALKGATRVQERCAACNEPITRHFVVEPQHEIKLPYPIIHPWRRSLVASLLGITSDELSAITSSEECSELAALTEAALPRPLRSMSERLSRTTDEHVRVTLLRGFEELERALQHGLCMDDLWLVRLRMLSPRLLFDGYRFGAPDLLESPLTKRYRAVLSLVELAQGRVNTLPQLRQAHWIELQRRIDELFGSAERPPEPGTLAELWLRVWPSTAPGTLRLSCSGLFSHASGRELRKLEAIALWTEPEALEREAKQMSRGLLGEHSVLDLPLPSLPAIDATDEQAWTERAAWAHLTGPALTSLAAMFLGIDGDPRVRAGVRSLLPADVAELPDVGRLLLQQLIRTIEPPAGRPTRLVRLLLARSPLVLPADDEAARRALAERLAGLVDTDDRGGRIALEALGVVLRGFWHGSPTPSHPSGWTWARTQSDAPMGFRRTVPRLDDSAWEQWPDFNLLVRPLKALGLGSARRPMSAGTPAWFGLPAAELPAHVDWGSARTTVESSTTAAPPGPTRPPEVDVTPSPVPVSSPPTRRLAEPDVPDVVILRTSLSLWLSEHL